MRKRIGIVLCLVLCALALTGCKEEKDKNKIVLNEVAHSIFYAPQYVAYELGYFEDEGLDVTIVNGAGADNTMTAVLAGEAEIGFMGSEQSIFVYNQGAEDYVVNFAQLTQRAGNFLVVRSELLENGSVQAKKNADGTYEFDWNQLKGKTVVGGRKGGMPQMVFEYILKQKGIAASDMEMIQNIDFGLTGQAFAAGTGDFTVEFEPAASSLEAEGVGTVVASCGVESGYVPYTAYCARGSYIKENPEIIEAFTRAIQKGLDYVNSHTPAEIAEVILPQFEGYTVEQLTVIVERYQVQDTWKENLVFEKESFELLQDILDEAGELEKRAPYEELVTTEYVK
ncbi:MAG: ABC transporter substrate-binding protein [Lachnospiraceae bacterium]|nr:ABC transporter substrate-binding protein [Lachnospiraceae bacterium]